MTFAASHQPATPLVRAEVYAGRSSYSADEMDPNVSYYDLITTTSAPPGPEQIIIGGNTSHALLDFTSNHTLCDFYHILYATTYPISSKILLWFCVLCIIIIVVLNGLVLAVLTVYWPAVRRLRNATSMRPPGREAGRAQQELYIANLAFCDFFIGLFLFPLWLLETVVYGCWTFPQWACRWRKILSWVLGFESGITVGLIALDRFMMVRLGPMYSQRETRTHVCLKIIGSWLIDIAFYVPLSYYDKFTGKALSINGFCLSEFYQNWTLFWYVYYIYYAVPVGFCVGIYIAIFTILKHRRHEESVKRNSAVLASIKQQQTNGHHQNNFPLVTLTADDRAISCATPLDNGNAVQRQTATTTTKIVHQRNMYADPFKRRYRKAWLTMIFLNAVFAMWWLPFWLVSLVELGLKSLAEPAQQTRASFVLHDIKIGIEVIFYLNSLLNPCIYLTTIPSLRSAAYKLLTRLMCCRCWPLLSRRGDRTALALATGEVPSFASPSAAAMYRPNASEFGEEEEYPRIHRNSNGDLKDEQNGDLLTEALLNNTPQRPRRASMGKKNSVDITVLALPTRRRATVSAVGNGVGGKMHYLNVVNNTYSSRTSSPAQSPVSMISLGEATTAASSDSKSKINYIDNLGSTTRTARTNRERSESVNVPNVATTAL